MPSYEEGRHRDPSARRHHRSESSSGTPKKRRGTSSHALSADALAQLNASRAAPSSTAESSNAQDERRRERREERRERPDREERREARREREERRERKERRERRDRQQAEEREARRAEEERREWREREEGLGVRRDSRHDSRRVSETRRTSRDVYESSRTRSEDRRRRHRDDDRERERRRESRGGGGRESGRDYTDDERRERKARKERREQHEEYDQYERYDRHNRESTDRRTKHYSIDHEDDFDDDEGYDRVEAGGAADRRHRARRDRRIPSGAVLEEGLSRGLRKTSAGRHAAAATAAGAGVGAAAAVAGGSGGGRGIFGRWRGHLRGGFGSSRGSNSSGVTRDSIDKSKEEQLYYAKQRQSPPWTRKKKLIIFGGIGGAILIIIIAVVAVVVSKKHSGSSSSSSSSSTGSGLGSISPDSIPSGAPSYLNPYDWVSVTDFNLTYTNETVGGLPIMGLNTSYDDSASANSKTKPLNEEWGSYSTTPARGVNLGGWLSIEPFITPSLFNYNSRLGIIDEYTLCSYLGTTKCSSTLENHYASFVTESTFAEIAAAGLDHVRIPFSYWAVEVYEGDPYLFRTSWRYLLRGIEWARKHGLRVNLDLHGLPGSQNGWNHSGRQGLIGWMNGTDGDLNVQRSLDVHDKLSQFFAQPRYKNIISHYGLANEPRMTFLPMSKVMNWTTTAAAMIRKNGINNNTFIVFSDGFYGLSNWQGQPNDYNLVLDVHQYEIFNNGQIVYTHEEKIEYACTGWTEQTEESMDTATGFGPTITAEWSQADTDCATYLGNVGNGNRWTGTYDVGNASLNALTPMCPLQNQTCSCTNANADPSTYSAEYKSFLLTFAEAQMYSFEKGWGWWYWTWDTETATQWSYKQGLAAGILPTDASSRTFQCTSSTIPSFTDLPEYY
ncbi:hypothetical protein SEUCBS139899_003814 [Sporothrix eucalyptigena]|uniref:glucan 1,3-beta-glucosidase n=1 Tax=Sporothrix eucalyptigena TaxID=1812306 RepID=A0ABP0BF89_9PEZI